MTKRARTGKTSAPGFTLLEIILALVAGLFLTLLTTQVGDQAMRATRAMRMVNLEFETIHEAERVTAEYRERIDEGTLNLDSLLSSWATQEGVTMQTDAVSVQSTDGSFTFRHAKLRRVRMTKDGQAMTTYFTE